MKHYRDPQDNLFGLDDNVVPPSDYTEITIEEAREIAASKVPPFLPDPEFVRMERAYAYSQEADPLFFKSQRGEATEAEWLAKVEEIKERYPYPPVY
jgi:hypothetical protein